MNFSNNLRIIGHQVLHFKSINSTNLHATELIAKSNPTEGTVISADFQHSGKGQRNNKWQSTENLNLLFSLILYPRFLNPNNQFFLSMFSAVAITTILETYLDPQKLFIKWPNDIYFDQKKIAGILIQNSLRGNSIESSIIGIGLNVNQVDFSPELPNPTSLKLLSTQNFDRSELLDQLLSALDEKYKQLLNGCFLKIKSEYENKLFNRGITGQIIASGKLYEGIILGVETDGRIIVNIDGKIRKLTH